MAVASVICVAYAVHAQPAKLRTIHVFVALADNQHQGIIPVPAKLGNGEDAPNNLYWGSAYGVKTFFSHSQEWERILCTPHPKPFILERCVFRYKSASVYLIADAYRGTEINQAVLDFFESAAGGGADTIAVSAEHSGTVVNLAAHGAADLLAYIGHDGLMDFQLPKYPQSKDGSRREVIVLACASKQFFRDGVLASGADPLLWTTGLMAPEAYTLKSALDGWIVGEDHEQIRDRAAGAYDKYQKCGLKAAHRLFASGW
jgi:hypothetical protein